MERKVYEFKGNVEDVMRLLSGKIIGLEETREKVVIYTTLGNVEVPVGMGRVILRGKHKLNELEKILGDAGLLGSPVV